MAKESIETLITAEVVRALFDYDPTTGIFTRRVTVASNAQAGSIAGSAHKSGYIHIGINRTAYKAHRIAWLHHYGEWPDGSLDHINGDVSDNRIANLRIATIQQNCANARTRWDNTTGKKGVKKFKSRWQARIGKGGEYHLGTFDTQEEAAAAYAGAAKVLYGKFARLS